MNNYNINDKNMVLLKKFSIVICILLVSSACNQSPTVLSLTPINRHATTAYSYEKIIFIGNKKLRVEIVKTEAEMAQGLSGRNKLSDSEGMLFDFGKLNRPAFWMKDMNFDLDLIWIANKKVVGITNDVPAPARNWKLEIGNLPTYSPPSDVDMVLEVNAGWSKENGIKIGDGVIDMNDKN